MGTAWTEIGFVGPCFDSVSYSTPAGGNARCDLVLSYLKGHWPGLKCMTVHERKQISQRTDNYFGHDESFCSQGQTSMMGGTFHFVGTWDNQA